MQLNVEFVYEIQKYLLFEMDSTLMSDSEVPIGVEFEEDHEPEFCDGCQRQILNYNDGFWTLDDEDNEIGVYCIDCQT